MIVTTWPGSEVTPGVVDPGVLADLWRVLGPLSLARIAHGRIDPDHMRLDDLGGLLLVDWEDSTLGAGDERLLAEGASLLVTSAVLCGTDEAVIAAVGALPAAHLEEVLALLQPAALSAGLRRHVKEAGIDLKDLRRAVAAAIDADVPDLVELHRVSLSSLITAAAAALGATVLFSSLSDIGIDTLTDALSEASLGWLLAALVVGQLPRLGQAFSTIGASPKTLPLGPTTLLQLAVSFVNLVVPSTAARVATVVRYQQRFGVPAKDAVTAGAVDSVAGFVVQIFLLVVTLGFGLASLDLELAAPDSTLGSNLWAVVLLVAIAAAAALLVGRVRRAVGGIIQSALAGVRRVAQPTRAAEVFGGNLASELLFSLTLGLAAEAYGYRVDFADLVAVNVLVSLVAGLMPIPGGIGVAEGALTAGLVAAGLPQVDALAAALSYRVVTFYLPPLWEWFALNWLRHHDYL